MHTRFFSPFFLSITLSMMAFSAEEEFTILVLEANLIGEIKGLQAEDNPERIINSYYSLLDKDAMARIGLHRAQLISLTPRYEIAYKAADSPELSELMDKISFHWRAIKSMHARHFVRNVQKLLSNAYDQKLLDASLISK
ncbi:MAG: hypothetical protein ACJA2D_001103 [Pseudohongiellaceae bacterium]|jgi:hypothetical protein